MPKIIKRKDNEKGLILISHREKPFFDYLRKKNTKTLADLFENYSFVVHVGACHSKMNDGDYIDAIFSAPGNITNIDNIKDKILPISSREFPPKDFIYAGEEKNIDVVVVTRASKFRNAERIIGLAQGLIDSGKDFKAVFIITALNNNLFYSMGINLEKIFWDKFAGSGFSNSFSFIYLGSYKRTYPLPRWFVADILKRSKYYFHTCGKEGESRALGEALIANCGVYYPKGLIGGGGEWARNDENCFSYVSERDAGIKIMSGNGDLTHNKFKEHSVDIKRQLDSYLLSKGVSQSVIDTLHKEYDLSMLLPGHIRREYSNSDWIDGNFDIANYQHLKDFLICAGVNTKFSVVEAIQVGMFFKIRKWVGNLKGVAWIILKKLRINFH
ncbi:MAG: hypothetical protein FE834_04560 [Gammaproteobacteria bacterium]|nr:hypothetical protein [Gammaproteobacteria bacterium]